MTGEFRELWVYLSTTPLLGLTATLVAYQAALWIYRKAGQNPLLNPVLLAVIALATLLVATGVPYGDYFAGAQFVANAAFNNLGRPNLSSLFNWAKATIGTIPFAMVGADMAGPEGVLAGTAIGSVIFGIASVYAAYRIAAGIGTTSADGSRP